MLQGLAGWMDLTGEPDGPPTKSGLSLVDYSGGFVAAISLLAGLHAARRDGVGMDCDVSLYDTAIAHAHLPRGVAPQRRVRARSAPGTPHTLRSCRSRPSRPRTAGWSSGAPRRSSGRGWPPSSDHPEWAEADSPYGTFADRQRHSDALLAELEEIFRERTVDEWLSVLYAASIPCGPINDVAQRAARGAHPAPATWWSRPSTRGTARSQQLASPVRVGSEPPSYRRAPRRNEDFDHVVREIARLRRVGLATLQQAGAFGTVPAVHADETEAEAAAR